MYFIPNTTKIRNMKDRYSVFGIPYCQRFSFIFHQPKTRCQTKVFGEATSFSFITEIVEAINYPQKGEDSKLWCSKLKVTTSDGQDPPPVVCLVIFFERYLLCAWDLAQFQMLDAKGQESPARSLFWASLFQVSAHPPVKLMILWGGCPTSKIFPWFPTVKTNEPKNCLSWTA